MSQHALLSPSSAARWMVCPGSVALSKQFPDTSSEFADEGTAAHILAERCLTYKKNARFYLGEIIYVGKREFTVDEDMAANVQVYLDYIERNQTGMKLLVEQRLPLAPLTGEQDAFGTSDGVLLGDDTLHICDLKYGRGVSVDAADNAQMKLYAAAARLQYEMLGDFKHFKVTIIQPRLDHIDEATFTGEELDAFVAEVKAVAPRALDGTGELQVSEKGCRWCCAKAVCPVLTEQVMAATATGFEDLTQADQVDLSVSMAACDMIEDWIKAVRSEVERRLLQGQPVKGFKLVRGRMGARQWADAKKVEEVLKKQMRLSDDIVYKKTLVSPTQAEKVFKDNPKRWMALQDYITQKEGAPSVAPESDERPALSSVDSFEDLTGGDLV